MTSPQWVEMAAAFALDALEPEERAAFEAQLRVDPTLQALVDEYRGVVGAIAGDLPPASPSLGLRERILAEAGRSSRVSSATLAPIASKTGHGVWPMRLALAASVILAIALGTAALRDAQRAGDLEEQVAALSGQLGELRAELASTEIELARYDSIAATFAGQSLRFVSMTAPNEDPRLHLIHNQDEDLLLVAASNLPPATAARVYQLWGIREGEDPVSLGIFNTGPENTALQALAFPGTESFDIGAVTEEPAGGSPQPTTTPFLVGEWSGGAT